MVWISDLPGVLRAEIRRYYAVQWSHLGDSLAWFIYTFLVFVAAVVILNGISGGAYGRQEQLLVMVGWLTWAVASDVMAELPHIISEEAQTGTLEQVSLLPLPLMAILVLRSLAYFLGAGVRGVIAAAVLLFFIPSLSGGGGLALALLFLISLLGAFGLGFLIAGAALVYKRTRSLANLVFSLMIFLTGSLVGLESLGRLFDVLRFLLPLTWGISLMRAVLAGEQTLRSLYQAGALFGLAAHSVVYLAVGLMVFHWGHRSARLKGTLSHY